MTEIERSQVAYTPSSSPIRTSPALSPNAVHSLPARFWAKVRQGPGWLVISLLFLALVLPGIAEARPSRGVSECARFYVEVAQEDGVPSPWVGEKVKGCHRLVAHPPAQAVAHA